MKIDTGRHYPRKILRFSRAKGRDPSSGPVIELMNQIKIERVRYETLENGRIFREVYRR